MSFVNQNDIDRAVRVVLGLIMLVVGWSGALDNLWGVAFRLFGWYPVITGAVGWCPFYVLFDFSSRRGHSLRGRSQH